MWNKKMNHENKIAAKRRACYVKEEDWIWDNFPVISDH